MKLFTFDKICFCLPLRIGAILLAYFNLLLSIATCLLHLYYELVKSFIRAETSSHRQNTRIRIMSNVEPCAVVVYGVAEIIMTLVVLIGIHKEKYKLVIIYMYYTIVTSVTMFLCRMLDIDNEIWNIELGTDVIYFGFKIYYILTIRSQAIAMKSSKKDAEDEVLATGMDSSERQKFNVEPSAVL